MATVPLVERLKASGGAESAEFLNDIIEQLWPNINAAGSKMVKDIVEPMFATMLPGPLASLHFVKIDLGKVPLRISEVDVHKASNNGIKLDMDVDWDGKSDIELQANILGKIGVEHVKLRGRLSILLCPLTNVIPLIGAAQVAFINPPTLKLDFTNAANIADCDLIDGAIRKVILNIIASMAVLPNRFLVKLDASNDYFKTYQDHIGILRVTVERASGISGPKKSGAKRLLAKLVKDVPDCYCKVNIGADEPWRTSTKKNDHDPEWNETHDFLVMDHDQCLTLDIKDDDLAGDDDIGIASTSVKDLLLAGGSQELDLLHKGEATNAKLKIRAHYYDLIADVASFSATDANGQGDSVVGLATILIASVLNLQGNRDDLNPAVKVSWAGKEFTTPAKSYSPGTDIFNPSYDTSFRIPITRDMLANPSPFKITLLNKKTETGSFDVPFEKVREAPGMALEDKFDVGSGVTVRAMISVRGTRFAK